MSDIVLTTLNARYHHASFGLRYLQANLGELAAESALLEFGIRQHSTQMLDAILAHDPRIVGLGVYVWNAEQALHLASDLKRVRPDVTLVLGGPEVSYETAEQPIVAHADYVICGEADLAFPQLCRELLAGRRPAEKVITAAPPLLNDVRLPYELYTDEDIANRVLYVEASRGCPFQCEFCLSSLDIPVRQFPLDVFLQAMQGLLDRGANVFKFVDRTFNLNVRVSGEILRFFLDRYRPGLFLHFEMVPDRFPAELRELVAAFPPGSLQFEIGVQTFNPEVAALISRRQDYDKLEENVRFLRDRTAVHLHTDLIVGLPGETVDSFAAGFDRLVALGPQEIQVGILKRLKGTPIIRHDEAWDMVYSDWPPFEILRNRLIDFSTMNRLKRFARFWDLVGNSGNFVESIALLWRDGSPFAEFLQFSDWLYEHEGRNFAISLVRLAEQLFRYLVSERGCDEQATAEAIWQDYQRGGRSDHPHFLRGYSLQAQTRLDAATSSAKSVAPVRQTRHRSG